MTRKGKALSALFARRDIGDKEGPRRPQPCPHRPQQPRAPSRRSLGAIHWLANAMYYPQQSPGIPHKLANHHDNNPWRLPMIVQQPGQQSAVGPPPPSPGYALYTNGALQHHPGHHLQHPPPLQHHHQSSMSHYPSPPNQHTHQQHILAAQGSPASATPVVSAHWQNQLIKCEVSRHFIYL